MSEALQQPATSRLLVTDAGYFPNADGHYRRRDRGSGAAIFLLCTEGSGFLNLGLGRLPVHPGQVAVIPAGMPHEYGADAEHPWTLWWMHVAGSDLSDLVTVSGATRSQPLITLRDAYRFSMLIGEAIDRMESSDSDMALTGASGAAWHALTLLRTDRRVGSRDDPIQDIVRYLQDNVGERVSVADLAARAMLSPTHFAALFRKATGLSVLQYQTSLAMNKARVLLDNSDLPVATIATMVGYKDPFYFSRQFRAVHGANPTQYRKGDKG
ncbi:MAG: AraC family transcriptional regulator [Propionibacteriaceae bacterium]|nr:AraC family transcriptional regulator [Propionibacteriaceae bacterium]